MSVYEYRAQFLDNKGRGSLMKLHAGSDSDAAKVANALAAKSDASWVGLQKVEPVTVDPATYTNYQDAAKPTSGKTVMDQGMLFYAVQSRSQQLKVTIPAVLESLLSPTTKTIGADPIDADDKLIDEEGVAVTGFVRGRYKWSKRKGL